MNTLCFQQNFKVNEVRYMNTMNIIEVENKG